MRSLTLLAAAILLAAAPLAPAASAQTCSTSWTDAAGGDWSDGAAWDNGVPTAASDACITLDGTYTVTLDVNATVTSLTLGTAAGTGTQTLLNTNRTLNMTAPSVIQATGVYDWQGGTTTAAATLTNDGRIAMSGADLKDLGGNTTIRNQALATLDGTGPMRSLGGNVMIVNAAGATFDLLSDADFTIFNGGNVFTNEGLFRKTGGGDVSQVSQSSLLFDNEGTVEAQAGTIRFNGNGTHTNGVFTASAGAEVLFDAGTHTLVGTLTGTPAGAVRLNSGATLVDDGAGATLDLGGTGLEWQGGALNGTLTNANLLRLTTADIKDMGANAVITNTSLVEMTDTGVMRFLGGNVTFVNAAGATFDIQSDADFSIFNGGNTFTNEGTLRKTGGGDVSQVSQTNLLLDNAGTVEAQTGTIRFNGSGTHTNGVFTASAGAEVLFDAGTHTLVGTLTGTPVGAVRLNSGATLTGGTLDVGGTGFEWQGGDFGTVTNAGLLRLTGSDIKDILGGATVTNTSLVEMTDTGVMRFIGAASAFVNAAGATFDIQSDADFSTFNGGNTFTNTGTLRKTGGASASVISRTNLAFDNAGTVEAQTGTLQFDGSGTHTDGVFSAAAGAEVYFNAGTHTGTMEGAPDGVVRFDSGATLSDATLSFDGTGFEWQAGIFATVTNAGLLRLTTSALKNINAGATVTNTSLVEMTDAGPLRFIGATSAFVNAAGATFDIQSDADFTTFNGGNTFTNAGLFQKTGGAGASIISTSAVSFTNAAGGVVSAESGTLDVNGVFDHAAGALIQGTATVDFAGATLTQDGDTGPGTSPGVLAWTGDWAPSATSALFSEIGGTVAGADYDQLAVSGAATMAGDLVLSIADGALPAVGDSYTVLTAASVGGMLGGVVGPDGWTFDVVNSGAEVVVTVTAVGVSTELTGAEGWRMLAPSVTGQTLDGLLGERWTQGFPGSDSPDFGVPSVFLYDEDAPGDASAGYVVPGDQADAVAPGTGVFAYIFADDDYDGPDLPGFPKTIVQSGTDVTGAFPFGVTYTPSGGPDEDGWALVGNPYAASLDWTDPAWTRDAMSATLYVWDPGSGQYLTHDTVAGSLPGGLVAPAQGFWVQATGAAPALEAPASARTTGGAFAGRQPAAEVAELRVRRAADTDGRRAASAHVLLAPGAADGRDALDGYELRSLAADALGLWTERLTDGEALDLQALPPAPAREIPLAVAAWEAGAPAGAELVLTWPRLPATGTAVLHDLATGETVDLRQAEAYAFTLAAGESVGAPLAAPDARAAAPSRQAALSARFRLALGGAPVADEPEPTVETELLAPAPNPTRGAAVLRYALAEAGPVTVTVHDLLGRTVAVVADGEVPAGAHAARLDAGTLASGVYVVRMTAPGYAATQRLTIVR